MEQAGSEIDIALTPAVSRAARALLAWSQQDLAKAADVATSTIADFERGRRTPVANNAQAIRAALEAAGVTLLGNGAVHGPSIPGVAGAERKGAPLRWVTAQDLAQWADRFDGVASFPTLISRLMLAGLGSDVRLRFPAEEGTRHPGWDGQARASRGDAYVPEGPSVWELGAQRSRIALKASEDYTKRSNEPGAVDPASNTFVFVTPRHWPQKLEWTAARVAEGVWRDVRAYDADDLVHWIERNPAVGLWLARQLGKRPPGLRELDEVWNEWSQATQWPFTETLVLTDRDEEAAAVLKWLRAPSSVLSLQASSADEVVAFFHSVLTELPNDAASAYRARCLVATTTSSARSVADAMTSQILILTDPDPGLAQSLAREGHHVLQAFDQQPIGQGDIRTLSRPTREGIASALIAGGQDEARARALARDSARNLVVLRRQMPAAPGHLPAWAENPPQALLAALLLGGWTDTVVADRRLLETLAQQPYDAVIAALTPYIGAFDSPLQKVGPTWRMASPLDAWFLLAHRLNEADLGRFEVGALDVLASADPRFELPSDERWMADINGVRPEHSALLRHGIGKVLILMALWGDRIPGASNAKMRPQAVVRRLFEDADAQRWWSLSNDFRLLSEAAPKAFMDALQDALDVSPSPLLVLFRQDKDALFGGEHLSDLMWALETLAWSPEYFVRVTRILARLTTIDDPSSRTYSNGPAASLRSLHLLWSPQTYASLKERLVALDGTRRHYSDAAWALMFAVLPQHHAFAAQTPTPRWRDFTVDNPETITWTLIGKGAGELSRRILEDVGTDPERWGDVLDRLGDLSPDADMALDRLEAAEALTTDVEARGILWEKLRRLLHHHRQFEDADWALPGEVLDRLQILYDRFAPDDELKRIAWLFENAVALPTPSPDGWEGNERAVDLARQKAASELYRRGGHEAIFRLAAMVDTAGYIGKAMVDAGTPLTELEVLIEAAVRADSAGLRDVGHGLIVTLSRDLGADWFKPLLQRARNLEWGDIALLTILRALPVKHQTWTLVESVGGEVHDDYWRRMPVFRMTEDVDELVYAIRKLIAAGRARHALSIADIRGKLHLPSDVLLDVLSEASRQPVEGEPDNNEAVMFQHYVAEILQRLDQRSDVDRSELAKIEWTYLRVLDRSRRPPRVLLEQLAADPEMFMVMVRAVFRPTDESGVIEPQPADPEQARNMSSQAYRLLEMWNYIPGTGPDGKVDSAALIDWITRARTLASAAGRQAVADSRIGNMLANSEFGEDGHWPAEAVRDALDLFRSTSMTNGFIVGKSNLRGVTVRDPGEGGSLERGEAHKYRSWAKAVEIDHPVTARALESLAERYDWQAQGQDEDAERLDWLD